MTYRAMLCQDWINESSKPDEPRITDEMFLDYWIVLRDAVPRFNKSLTEAEARVIEFAMQAIHAKRVLMAVDPDAFERIPAAIPCEVYSGPTDEI